MSKPLLKIESVCKMYPGNVLALNNINIKVSNSEIIAILGPSGSGKSTLIRTILGLTTLNEGNIYFRSKNYKDKNFNIIRNSIATIYQNFNLVSRSSIIKNIILGDIAKVSSWRLLFNIWPKKTQNKAINIIKEVGLRDIDYNKRVENLSGGQQQRVGIARALIGSPDIILADEPVSSLDPQTAKDILNLIRETAKKNKISVLCSLHQIDFAKIFADRIIGMKEGKILFDKPAKKLLKLDLDKLYK
jgi:phosphonate transport system ATP-binding protein